MLPEWQLLLALQRIKDRICSLLRTRPHLCGLQLARNRLCSWKWPRCSRQRRHNFSLVTCPIPGTKTISSSRETAHGAFGKAGFTIERKQACLAALLDAQGQAAHSGELEVAVVSSGRREIVSASQIAKHWGAFPDLKKKVLKLRGGGTVPLLSAVS